MVELLLEIDAPVGPVKLAAVMVEFGAGSGVYSCQFGAVAGVE